MSQSILLVDDEEVFLSMLARAMHRQNYTVETANHSEQAIAVAQQTKPDYACVDLKLANESGLALIPALLAANPSMKIVMLTGFSSITTAVEAIKLGAVNYLCKPASSAEIIAALDAPPAETTTSNISDTPPSVNRLEWEHIQKILQENDGNISATARALGMHRRTLQRKLQKKPVKQ